MSYPFWCCGIPTNMTRKTFCDQWRMFNAFVPTCAVKFHTTHGQKKTFSFDTEGFMPVDSLCGEVGSTSWFDKCLIGRTRNIWSVMYIYEKCIYLSETRACTIIECAIVRNVLHVNSTWPFIYSLSSDANDTLTPRIERTS